MDARQIYVWMKEPSVSQALGIWTSSYDAGRVGDSGATQLVFQRPEKYQTNNLRLLFQVGYNDVIQVDIGQSNTFTLTAAQTKQTTFVLQIEFTDGNGIIATSNKLTYYLTSSISKVGCMNNTDYVQELLQFALSQKVNELRFIQEVSEDKSTDPETAPWKMVGFNHMGDMILNLTLPQFKYTERAGIADTATKALTADTATTATTAETANQATNAINADLATVSGYGKELGKFVVTGTSSDTRLLGISFHIPVNLLQSTNLHLTYRGSKINSVAVNTLTNNTYSFSNQTYLSSAVFPELQLVLERSISGETIALYTFTFETYGTLDSNNYYGVLKLKETSNSSSSDKEE